MKPQMDVMQAMFSFISQQSQDNGFSQFNFFSNYVEHSWNCMTNNQNLRHASQLSIAQVNNQALWPLSNCTSCAFPFQTTQFVRKLDNLSEG